MLKMEAIFSIHMKPVEELQGWDIAIFSVT